MSTGYERFENEPGSCDGKEGVPIPQYPAQQYPVQYPSQQPPAYVHQGAPYAQVPGQQTIIHTTAVPAPPDYFGFALFVTFCCFLPLGIVALIKSGEVRSRAAMGDSAGALLSSAEAKKFSWIGCIVGGVSWVSVVIFIGVYAGIVFSSCYDC